MPRRVRHALPLLAVLTLAVSLSAPVATLLAQGGSPASPQQTAKLAPSPGIYSLYDYRNIDKTQYHLVGGHQSYDWRVLEPSEGSYSWGGLDNWLAGQAEKGKPAALGIEIYGGSGRRMPDYVYAGAPPVICGSNREVPRYWSDYFLQKYRQFILAFGNKYRDDPRVAWVQIGAGIYQETQPEISTYKSCVRDAMAADLGTNDNVVISAKWVEVVNYIQQAYKDAFGNSKPVLVQYVPVFLDWQERFNRYNPDGSLLWEGWVDYAAAREIGLKHAGLLPDHWVGGSTYRDQENHYQTVAIGYEPGGFGNTTWELYWALLAALNNHADYVALFPSHFLNDCNTCQIDLDFIYPHYDFFNAHAGVTLATTPDVWVALRDSSYKWGDHDNFNFWLSQDHGAPGGKSQGVTTRPANTAISYPNPDIELDTSLPDHPFSSWTRRTDQGSGNPFMYFNVDDGYIFGGSTSVEITITYLDRGRDKWQLVYDAVGGERLALEQNKTGTDSWKTVTINIGDAAFQNGISGNDLRLDSTGDGDDYFHMIRLRRTSAPPTPTPTATPVPQVCPTGDLDHSGQVDANDVQLIASVWMQQKPEYDLVNNDGVVTVEDIMEVANQFNEVCRDA